MFDQSLHDKYVHLWGNDPPLLKPPLPPPAPVEPPRRPPPDTGVLEHAWQQAARDIIEAARGEWMLVKDSIYHPHLSAFYSAIINSWDSLGDAAVFTRILGLIEKMHDEPLTAVVAYEQFQASLRLAGEAALPELVADRQKRFMDAHPTWRQFRQRVSRESVSATPQDYIPGGLPQSPEPDQPLDAWEGANDPFAQ